MNRLDSFLRTLKEQVVRDLAWTILAPCSLTEDADHRLLTQSFFDVSFDRTQQWIQNLDAKPQSLLQELQQKPTYRLGLYFESLLLFWMRNSNHYSVVAHNYQVHDEGQTIGAFDYVLEGPDGFEHWEVAVKYYLGIGHHSEWHHWIGPNQVDRLDLKMAKMCGHQIALSQHKLGRAALINLGIHGHIRQRIILKGCFFRPWDIPSARPYHTHHKALGVWVDAQNIQGYLDSKEEHTIWVRREKPDWLTPVIGSGYPHLTKACLRSLSQITPRPVMLSQMHPNGEERHQEEARIFLVPPGWRTRAYQLMNSMNNK